MNLPFPPPIAMDLLDLLRWAEERPGQPNFVFEYFPQWSTGNKRDVSHSTSAAPTYTPVPNLPTMFRLESVVRFPGTQPGLKSNTATLISGKVMLTVRWEAREVDSNICVGAFVAVQWGSEIVSDRDINSVASVHALTQPDGSVNPFDDVPDRWILSPWAIEALVAQWRELAAEQRLAVNARIWNGKQFIDLLKWAQALATLGAVIPL